MPGQVSDFAGDGNPESAEIELKNWLHRAAFGLVVRVLRLVPPIVGSDIIARPEDARPH